MIVDGILPPRQGGPAAWVGEAMAANVGEWQYELTAAEVAELEAAAEPLLTDGFNVGQMTKADFPLPTLAAKLARLRQELLNGRGFSLWRGLPVATYTEREAVTIFYGLGTHLGNARS